MSREAPRLDKKHGFLSHITRNQMERKDYHEQKLKEKQPEHDTERDQYNGTSVDRSYMNRPNGEGVVFTMTIEYCPSKLAILSIKQDDVPDVVAKDFAKEYGMRSDLVSALALQISQKMGT